MMSEFKKGSLCVQRGISLFFLISIVSRSTFLILCISCSFKDSQLLTFILICVAETAENISYSCNLLREDMNDVFIVAGNSPEEVKQELRSEE